MGDDLLTSIFRLQRELNDHIGRTVDESSPEGERERYILDMARASMHELCEIEDCLPWKWWYTEKPKTNWHNVREEIVDLLHFLVSMAIAAGMTPEMLYDAYVTKNRENHRRQDQGYTRPQGGNRPED